jgi:hypothetical protein
VEAAAYFVVSECLANVGKHAQATFATVSVTADDGELAVVVADDGVGGASLDDGTGMQGLADRVGALSGSLSLESPPGEGTRVAASIPLTAEALAAAEMRTADDPAPLPSAEEAEARQAERRQHLSLRSASLGIVAVVLVVIWALTGPGLPWIVWPLLAIGLIAGLDAWHVVSTVPLSDADAAGAEDPGAELRRLSKRRNLRHQAGALAILNVFLVGVWIASGSGYFWPAWAMLGSGIAITLRALPRPSAIRAPMQQQS